MRNIMEVSGATKGDVNGQLPISFGDLPIEIFLFQDCLFIFELDSNCIFFLSKSHMRSLLVLFLKN